MAKKKTTRKKTSRKKSAAEKEKKAEEERIAATEETDEKTVSASKPKKSSRKKKSTSRKKSTAKKGKTEKQEPSAEEKVKEKETEKKETEVQKKTEPEKGKDKDKDKEKTAEEKEKDEEEYKLECLRKAGEIAKKVVEKIKPMIKPGVKVIDIIDKAETLIRELGGKPGFPVNISINNVAAHYTSPPDDKTEIAEGDMVKFDMGVHIDGYSVDTAFTVYLGDDERLKKMVEASEEAVKVAVGLIKQGMKTNHIGNQIEKKIKEYGFRPIRDLTGHKIERWNIHGGKYIPCISTPPGTGYTMEKGEVYAVEVFVSDGEGTVHARDTAYIYQLPSEHIRIQLRLKSAKQILAYIRNEYRTLPFSKFQIYKEFPKASLGLVELLRSGKLISHRVLAEKKGFHVAQTECTVLVTEDGCEILT